MTRHNLLSGLQWHLVGWLVGVLALVYFLVFLFVCFYGLAIFSSPTFDGRPPCSGGVGCRAICVLPVKSFKVC